MRRAAPESQQDRGAVTRRDGPRHHGGRHVPTVSSFREAFLSVTHMYVCVCVWRRHGVKRSLPVGSVKRSGHCFGPLTLVVLVIFSIFNFLQSHHTVLPFAGVHQTHSLALLTAPRAVTLLSGYRAAAHGHGPELGFAFTTVESGSPPPPALGHPGGRRVGGGARQRGGKPRG